MEGFLSTSPIPPPDFTPSLNTVTRHMKSVPQLCSYFSQIPPAEQEPSTEMKININLLLNNIIIIIIIIIINNNNNNK